MEISGLSEESEHLPESTEYSTSTENEDSDSDSSSTSSLDSNESMFVPDDFEEYLPSPAIEIFQSSPSSAGSSTTRSLGEPRVVIEPLDQTERSLPVTQTSRRASGQSRVPDVSNSSDDDEGQTCPICLELWDNSGPHRIVSLKCGHLFGQRCIEKWLSGNGKKCPHCNSSSRKQDIRVVYANCVKVRDTTERDRARKDLEKERAVRLKMEVELMQARAKFKETQEELRTLQEAIRRQNYTPNLNGASCSKQNSDDRIDCSAQFRLVFSRTVDISKDGQCRVMALAEFYRTLVVSQPQANPLFPGFGFKKVNIVDFRATEYVGVHEKSIRDLCYNSNNLHGLILSASMDKTLKLTSLISNVVVQNYVTEAPVWSCSWNASNDYQFYGGLANGTVLLYDTRQTNTHICQLPTTVSTSPVVSLQSVPLSPLSSFSSGGLLVGQLSKCSFLESRSGDDYNVHYIPIEGPITSINFEQTTRHVLISCRPNSQYPYVRHFVCDMSYDQVDEADHVVRCNVMETLHGGGTCRQLTKNIMVQNPVDKNSLLVYAGDESSSSVVVWDVTKLKQCQTLPSNLPVLDICQGQGFIATLTEKSVQFYNW